MPMGTRRHGQEVALAPSGRGHSGNVVKFFYALVVTAKRSVDALTLIEPDAVGHTPTPLLRK